MAARQKTLDEMTPDEREAVLAQVQTFKQEHSEAEDPACGILRLRDGANREKAPLFYQVVAANKLLQQDLKWVRAARHENLVAAIGDAKPLDSRKASLLVKVVTVFQAKSLRDSVRGDVPEGGEGGREPRQDHVKSGSRPARMRCS